MATSPSIPMPIDARHRDEPVGPRNYLNAQHGIRSWIFTLDHKRIGWMYLWSVLIAFLLGGVMAIIMRISLMNPQSSVLSSGKLYNQIFTLHGAIMTFLFIIPSVPAALGNFFLPMQIGARDVAFPRLNLMSYWVYVIGAVVCLLSLVLGAADTGWTFYTPYSTTTSTAVTTIVLGAFILGFSSIFTGINFIATLHKLRAPGMNWFRMPLFCWSLYATAIIQVLATPVLGITLLLLIFERLAGVGIFDPAMGGDPILFQHFFWFYSHPAVYIMIVPGMGIISEIIPCFARKPIFGYHAIAFSSVGIATIGFLVWGHHMFVSGQSTIAAAIFSILTFLVALPSAIKVFNWLTTLYRGSIWLATPMLYALSFLFLFTIGGLTGVFLGALPVDVHVHDTYFVVAHFHYVMMGGTVIAFIGALHYWWPKMTGRMYPERPGQVAALLVFVGFNLTFFTQFVLGTRGMPRRYFSYLPQYERLHELSSYGSFILGIGLFMILFYLLWSLKRGAIAPDNPWGASTLEWRTPSPPPTENFAEIPVVTGGPYDYQNAPKPQPPLPAPAAQARRG